MRPGHWFTSIGGALFLLLAMPAIGVGGSTFRVLSSVPYIRVLLEIGLLLSAVAVIIGVVLLIKDKETRVTGFIVLGILVLLLLMLAIVLYGLSKALM